MRRIAIAAGLVAFGLVGPSPATAAHHLVKVREVFIGTAANPSAEYVELQLAASGENLVAGQASVRLYGGTGAQTNAATFSANPPNGQSQRTMLAATAEAAALFGVASDLILPSVNALQASGGSACLDSTVFGSVDCVSWGGASAPAGQSPSGTPAAAIPDGSSLTRSIAPGCATLLEVGDDTNVSASDLAVSSPTPQNNSTTPTEIACAPGGGGGGDTDDPNTKIKKGPEGKIETDKVTIRFKSNEAGSTFECKLDRRRYKPCRSPKKLKDLDKGKHRFRVRATDAAGNTDPTPAKLKFRVVEG